MIDYSLYVVTDPGCPNCEDVVQQAVANGATVVQLREKTLDTGALVSKAQRIHKITQQASIPLIINDRVDVCLAIDAEGVHLGYDDMQPKKARELLGPDKLIGVSVRDLDELEMVLKDGSADYIGIGAVYDTSTKKLGKPPMGTQGVSQVLKYLTDRGITMPSVIIGGLNLENSSHTVKKSEYNGVRTNGVAVVSCIMSAEYPADATRSLRKSLDEVYGIRYTSLKRLQDIKTSPPMILHVTNTVVQNFSANVTLAIGASPIMSFESSEYSDLAQVPMTAVVVNTGSPKIDDLMYSIAMKSYKEADKHVIFDPVGIGATSFRREFNSELFLKYKPDIVKCNAGEILSLIKQCSGDDLESSTMRGVDSTVVTSPGELVKLVKPFCERYGCIAAITGEVDLVCDKQRAVTIHGGDVLMTKITGTGCSLSSVLASVVASIPLEDTETAFEAIVDALACYKHCGKMAALKAPFSGSFQVEFLNQLHHLDLQRQLDVTVKLI
jgi:thiamine-phosphate diphosphorylase/hydroxyethylthiazole kinase